MVQLYIWRRGVVGERNLLDRIRIISSMHIDYSKNNYCTRCEIVYSKDEIKCMNRSGCRHVLRTSPKAARNKNLKYVN